MLGHYILCSESLVEVDLLTVEVKGIDNKSKVEVVRLGEFQVEGIDKKSKVEVVRLSKVKFKDVDNKLKRSTNKRSTWGRVATD